MKISHKSIAFVVAVIIFVGVVSPVRAQIIDSQSQIQVLLKQLVTLQEQLRLLQAAAPQSTVKSSSESWEKRFVTNATLIPNNALRAFYFDTKSPEKVVYQEVVGGLDTHYLPDNPSVGGIGADRFGGYWIGNYSFAKEEKYTIHISQGSSESRIRVDGKIVFEGTESKSIDYTFTPDNHKVEIEQVNKNWQMSGSSIFLLPWKQTYSSDELSKILKPQWSTKNAEVWLVSPYDVSGSDRTIELALKPTTAPVTLVLSSYIATSWIFPVGTKANIKAIVLSSYDKGINIKNVPPHIPVYVLNEWVEHVDPNQLVTICSVTESYCSGDNDVRVPAATVASFFGGKKPTGIGGEVETAKFQVPLVTLDEAAYKKLDAAVQASEKARSEYQDKNQLDSVF